jgi:CubicO group peptidase (beta-lactamase class C family)
LNINNLCDLRRANSQPALRSLRALAIVSTLAIALPAGISDAAGPAEERAAALDKAIPLAMQRASVPGAIVGIWQDGSEPYVRAFGVRDAGTGEKMAPDLYMRIGSNSKTFTVTAILMLADQGKLGLDDPWPLRRGRAGRRPDHAQAARGNAQRAIRLRQRY